MFWIHTSSSLSFMVVPPSCVCEGRRFGSIRVLLPAEGGSGRVSTLRPFSALTGGDWFSGVLLRLLCSLGAVPTSGDGSRRTYWGEGVEGLTAADGRASCLFSSSYTTLKRGKRSVVCELGARKKKDKSLDTSFVTSRRYLTSVFRCTVPWHFRLYFSSKTTFISSIERCK